MGVKTKVFGKFAWLVLEGIGRFYDEYMLLEQDGIRRAEIFDMTIEFFTLIGFILPCIYCRRSYCGFITEEIDIRQILALKNGGKQLVYRLHNRVSKKLWDQDREKYKDDDKKLEEINKTWYKYCIPYNVAIKERFPTITSLRFWNAVIVFLALIMCDYREDEASHIYRFFWLIGRILSRQQNVLVDAYVYALEQSLPLWTRPKMSSSLAERLDIVWILKNHVFNIRGWEFSRTRKDFEDQCRSAIVGCGKKS